MDRMKMTAYICGYGARDLNVPLPVALRYIRRLRARGLRCISLAVTVGAHRYGIDYGRRQTVAQMSPDDRGIRTAMSSIADAEAWLAARIAETV